MTKKNTSVVLPGGLAGLVREAQQAPTAAPTAATTPKSEPASPQAEASAAPLSSTTEPTKAPTSVPTTGWQQFEERARHYHRASNLGAVYIDRDLKRTLSRLRASSLGVSTSALVSAIVEQFLEDHKQDIARLMGE